MPISRLLALSVAAVIGVAAGAPHAHAHPQLPSEHWCDAGVEVVLATFNIQPSALVALREEDACPEPGSPILKDCGQFDDDYGTAKSAAGAACVAYMPVRQPVGDIGSVIFVIESPAQYNSSTHHADYSVQGGLSGACVRCDPPRPVKPMPLPPATQ